MTRFFVGQRVRIKWSDHWPELAGQGGVIVQRSPDGGIDGRSEWIVAPDVWGTPFAPPSSVGGCWRFAPNANQLEPIVPPHEACDADFKADLDRLLERQGVAA